MIVRCDSHPSIRQPEYRHRVDPVGYPSTAAICGIGGCANPGRILLKDPEWKAYQEGKRDFGANNNFTKVRAVGSPVPVAAPAEDLHRKSRTSPVPFLKRIFTQTFLVKESQMNSRSGAIPGQIRSISVVLRSLARELETNSKYMTLWSLTVSIRPTHLEMRVLEGA